ncbi:hypothetical protein L6452_42851 [Arctium lappa]|uniref:Uncharacterized protein n=1 Tax=Arctium lappa TaxID=4217 RepID=A0ACB8XJM0_ARCLA|nr:hypothetical protein L6452_42851 [Arctium lappa]
MTSRTTRKFTIRDDDLPESSRTRPRREIDPMEYAIPSSPRSLLHGEPNLNLSLGIRTSPLPPSPQQPRPQPQFPPPQPLELLMFHPIYVPQPPPQSQPQAQAQAQPQPEPQLQPQPQFAPGPRRNRRNPTHAPRPGKSLTIQPPFPWATNRRARVHSLIYLTERGITTISGEVQCKRCEQRYEIEYNLEEKFSELARFIAEKKPLFRHRAPPVWLNPTLPRCDLCHQENSVKPKMAEKKNSINWLFLLLGQMVGCCTLEQLKYFCKHTANHRTGAKDRILYLTYLGLCKQIDPTGPYDIFD